MDLLAQGQRQFHASEHPLVLLLSASFWVILWLLSWVKALVAFATITAPRLIYAILSYSMTLTLNFWSFAIIFTLCAGAANYWIRSRYLHDYMQLKELPLDKPDANELHPDVNIPDPPVAFRNYLDEFLQAIRVFGFLEKPVFHELARHLQTRRLIAGDSISLDRDRSFYCVVDGMVQVFAQTGTPTEDQKGSWDDEDLNGYQLLNEVGNGGTLSSLFTILSLFTEDLKMSWQEDDPHENFTRSPDGVNGLTIPPRNRSQRTDSDVSNFNLDIRSLQVHTNESSASSTTSTVQGRSISVPGTPSVYSTASESMTPRVPYFSLSRSNTIQPTRIHRGVVARATEDTTLAVIPAEAFHRVTKNFPKATGHIVQVILTRFSRVTFNAAHKYLGLTSEVLRTEKAINDIACHPLPASFYEGGGLQYLRARFDGSGQTEDGNYFTQVHPSMAYQFPENPILRRSNATNGASPARSGDGISRSPPSGKRTFRQFVQAGDLHSSAGQTSEAFRPLMRMLSTSSSSLTSRMEDKDVEHEKAARLTGDEFDLRDEVMSCIAKSIGLLQPPLSGNESIEASPAFPPSEHRSPPPFKSSFGSLSLLDLGDDVSSITADSSVAPVCPSGLDNHVEILFFAAGSVLAKAGERNTGLFYVIDGFLDILLPIDCKHRPKDGDPDYGHPSDPVNKRDKQQKLLFTVKTGGIAGYLSSLCNTASYVDIKAKTDTYVGFLPSYALERLLEKSPIVLLTLAKRLISLLSPLVLQIDAALDWMHVNASQVLWRPGDQSDSFYIVINGRLRAISEQDGVVTIVGEYGQGDSIGELDVITSSPRRTTVHAIRDTELIRMPQTLFNAISARNPQITAHLLRRIASRVRDELDSSSNAHSRNATSDLLHNNTNLKTVAVLPMSRNVPIDAFARKLHAALDGIGASTSYLNQASISNHLGRHSFSRMGKLKAAGWLADLEQRYRIVLYVANSPVNSSWTQTCIRQADCVMVIAMGEDPSLGEYERLLLSMKTTARKELILLHPERYVAPGSTRHWLKNRTWIHQHLHVELPGLVLSVPKPVPMNPTERPGPVMTLKNLKDKVLLKYRGRTVDSNPQRRTHMNDFARLARRICGKSIGVVLGGGGARGISHLGLLRALDEYGVPVDHIAGTSIGALMAGLYAREGDVLSSAARAKRFSSRMGNIWRVLSDVTYPIVAYTTGHEFNRAIYKAFYDLHIEDMWLPFFCNTTNINTSRMDIHETGYAWRFIRASMTLVGLLPPLCYNGNMLVDGGYIDNLPVSTMFSMGASAVFASDVGSVDDNRPRNFGDSISGWWLILNRWNPFSSARNVPAITEIQSRLAYVSSVKTLEDAKVMRGCLYMQMPVQEYGTLQFSQFEEIQKKGYQAAISMLRKWEVEGRLPPDVVRGHAKSMTDRKKGQSIRRNSI